MVAYVLGIDVGYSDSRRSTGLCLISIDEDSFEWQCLNTSTDRDQRLRDLEHLIPKGVSVLGVGVDGPLVPDLKLTKHYRPADALLSRGCFQRRGKPGQTSSLVGQDLHRHATLLAKLALELRDSGLMSIAQSTHSNQIHTCRIVEAFPTAFLSVLLADDDFVPTGRKKSDAYWDVAVHIGYLSRLIQFLLPGARTSQRIEELTDHDHRAAFICALTALGVASHQFVAVGDPQRGDIILPAAELWGLNQANEKWAEETLKANVTKVRANRKFTIHRGARILQNGEPWIQ